MNDDDKQKSYERLDETNPERNHRSFFDWLRGKEETDEEKLRKKLDEELKEAARKRAEQFEEERRVEEEREVAETKKLKKRWRKKLVEKSQRLLDEAAERGEEPANGYEIAKLMVAERIVKYHEMLEDETLDLRRSEVKALKIHIDFMGLLSEKLDRPELEVPKEVEQLYQTIASSVEEVTGEPLPRPEEPTKTPETSEPTPVSEQDAAYTAFAATIVHAIRRAIQSRDASSAAASETSAPAERLLSTVKNAALPGEAIREEITHAATVRHLAEIVEKAGETTTRATSQPSMEVPILAVTGLVKHEARQTMEKTLEAHSANPSTEQHYPDKDIEFWAEADLLRKAENIALGNGRYLAEAYRKGEIDREGLIKVLKSFNKGRDYRSEFLLRREKWRRHRESSLEHLTQPHDATQPVVPVDATKPTTKTPLRGHLRNIGRKIPAVARMTTQEARRIARETAARFRRQSSVTVLIISVLLVAVLFVILIEIGNH